jgi:putative ribosome biogenesis GTPase RsgA
MATDPKKIDKAGRQNDVERLICVIVPNVIIFVLDSPEFSLRFVERRAFMAEYQTLAKGLQHTMTPVVSRRGSVRHKGYESF